jgi:hypothetical protein
MQHAGGSTMLAIIVKVLQGGGTTRHLNPIRQHVVGGAGNLWIGLQLR